MFKKEFVKKYLLRGLIAAAVYGITVFLFLNQQRFPSIWLLYLGNGLFLFTVAVLGFTYNTNHDTDGTSVGSAISGHILSFTGAALSVILSLLMYVVFSFGIWDGQPGEDLMQAPSNMRQTPNNGMLFVLITNAALGNTISGFFAAVITSFSARRSPKRNLTKDGKELKKPA